MREVSDGDICPFCGKNVKERAEIQHQLQPFTILQGKYIVGDVLGEGGFGITYVGFDLNLEMRVAIKEFYPNGYVTRESAVTPAVTIFSGKNMEAVKKWQSSFLEEARSLAKCAQLPGVVNVKEFFSENNTVYIVQEFLDGITLKGYMKNMGGRIPVDRLMSAMEPVIVALAQVHDQGLIHRDISPDNIMCLNDGSMKVFDFGAARKYGDDSEKSVVLKPGYAPEEQYRTRGNQGPWSDVYALCATMYKCITGKTPVESMERMRNDTLQMPSAMGIAIPPALEATLQRGMAVFAESRIQNMRELHSALYSGGAVYASNPQQAAQPNDYTQALTGNYAQPQPNDYTQALTGNYAQAQPNNYTQAQPNNYTQSQPNNYTQPQPNNYTQAQPNNYTQAANYTQANPQTGYMTQNQNQMQYEGQGGVSNQAAGSGSNKKPLIIVGALAGAAVIALVTLLVLLLNGDRGGSQSASTGGSGGGSGSSPSSAVDNTLPMDIGEIEDETVIGEDGSDGISADASAALQSIADEVSGAGDWIAQGELLPKYEDFLDQYGASQEAEAQIQADYQTYLDGLNSFLDSMLALEPRPPIYGEMSMRMQEALDLAQELESRGVTVDREAVYSRQSELKEDYTNKICEIYDSTAEKGIDNNGQVSRGELWGIMQGADESGLYAEDDYNNPVRTRYASALALHVDSELQNHSGEDARRFLYDNLENSDFNPLLLYYLTEGYGDQVALELYAAVCDILSNDAGVYFADMSDIDKKNFAYEYSHAEYDTVRNNIRSYMEQNFVNPFE